MSTDDAMTEAELAERLEAVAALSEDHEQLLADLENAHTPEAVAATLAGYKVPPAGMERARVRERLLADLKGTLKSPAKFVDGWIADAKASGGDDDDLQGSSWKPAAIEPWESPVELADALDEARAIFDAYTYTSDACLNALALWTFYTHVYDAFGVAPLLDLTSPAMRCGKTSTLNIIDALGNRTLLASNVTPASVYRVIDQSRPTLLVDEADSFLSISEELRGILNSGHTRRAAFVIRCDGDSLEPRVFRTFAPKAVAAIGSLPSTLEDRSIKIALTRKPTAIIKADAYDEDGIRLACDPTRSRIARAADDYLAEIELAEIERPAGLNDRQWNNWKPLLAIASVAGGDWFKRAVEAAVTLSSGEADPDEHLLALRHVYEVLKTEPEGRLSTEAILGALASRDDGPWAEKWARDLNVDQTRRDIRGPSAALAKLLKPFGIKPKQVWLSGEQRKVRGYDLEWFEAESVAPFLAETQPDALENDGRDGRDGRTEATTGAASTVSTVPTVSEQADGGDW